MAQPKSSLSKYLRNSRKKRKIKLWTVAHETNIRTTVLSAIENARYDQLPHSVHTLGFVRRYAKFLGLDPAWAAHQYLQERGPLPKPANKLNKQRLKKSIIGSRLALVLVTVITLVVIAGYLVWQIAILTTPPTLNVEHPSDNQLVNSSELAVRGKTTAGAAVSINGQAVPTDQRGEFSATISLSDGLNIITIKSQNKRGKISTVERSVLVQPDSP